MLMKILDKILYSINKKTSKALILFLITSILGTGFLIGCNMEKEENLIDRLYKNKTEYIGDNSKVGNIISKLEYPKGYKYKSMEIMADEKPYSLILNFELAEGKNLSMDAFRIQSAIIFSLIDNLDEIVYVPVNSEVEGILPIDRSSMDDMMMSVLGKNTKELGSSRSKFEDLVDLYEEYDLEAEVEALDSLDKTELKATKYENLKELEGVTMFTREGSVNKKGLTLRFGNKIKPEVIYGEDFVLEKKIGESWYELPVIIDGEYGFNDVGYEITFEGGPDWDVNWEWLYGELHKGQYRIIKEVSNLEENGDYESYFLIADFEIE